MLAKLTRNNQLTLPEALIMSVGNPEYYDIEVNAGRIILTPVKPQQADTVRNKIEALGINEQDVNDAIQWARQEPI
ncbi:AbrB family transcriptional regulator [Methylovulum psychrotolerans]|uniref:AbrB family transcriptional regulator n=1 Tax=Methylovulum psychrotolerans TaxID=1704499 RepID=A0A1Z4BUQ7_9GAMM|nr:AbrB family transcriptional regulator [Methylovulum psychrotolerans]ASF45046.1 AbrB family transcriptional regulator [Methylovulum psychrotolerans]